MTVKQLKKELHVGRELTVEMLRGNMTVRGNGGVTTIAISPEPRYRRVVKVQSASVAFAIQEGECGERLWTWLRWPKSPELREVEGGFEILEAGTPVLRYKFRESTCDN